jgi:hypothetical protein
MCVDMCVCMYVRVFAYVYVYMYVYHVCSCICIFVRALYVLVCSSVFARVYHVCYCVCSVVHVFMKDRSQKCIGFRTVVSDSSDLMYLYLHRSSRYKVVVFHFFICVCV